MLGIKEAFSSLSLILRKEVQRGVSNGPNSDCGQYIKIS